MACDSCGSVNLLIVDANTSGNVLIRSSEIEKLFDVPFDIGIGQGNKIKFSYCADCGKIQGTFPVPADGFFIEEEIVLDPIRYINHEIKIIDILEDLQVSVVSNAAAKYVNDNLSLLNTSISPRDAEMLHDAVVCYKQMQKQNIYYREFDEYIDYLKTQYANAVKIIPKVVKTHGVSSNV